MRNMVAVLAALSLIAGLGISPEASAEAPKKTRHKHAQVQKPRAYRTAPSPDGYTERDANRLPFGSASWWEQMLRENRAGTCCN